MKKAERFRNEWKYLVNYAELALLRQRLAVLLQPDKHSIDGGYSIRSLYFDDYWNTAYNEKDAGVLTRRKWRIRIYNASDSVIHLERKKKYGSYIFKESASLTREQTDRILDGDYAFLLAHPDQLCREFYVECTSRALSPRVIVDYEREAWVQDEGTVRITFDTDVRAGILHTDLFDSSLPTLSALPPGKAVLEVKFTEFLPQAIREALPPSSAEFTAVSKFVLCCDKTRYLHGFESYFETEGERHQ